MQGTCGPIQIHGVNVPSNKFRNNPPYCKKRSTKCLAAAGGIGNINTPYYRTPAPGEKGCGCKFGSCDGGFVLKAGASVIDGVPLSGYISPIYSSDPDLDEPVPSIGSLKGDDASPIKNKDILTFVSAMNQDDLDGPTDVVFYFVNLKLTPENKKYLASRERFDAEGTPLYYVLILNINGKEYQGFGDPEDFDDPDGESTIIFKAPVGSGPTSGVPPLKQGETYNFSFK